MASSIHHTFDGRSWRIIKEFAGIYGVKINYHNIKELHVSDIYDALRWSWNASIPINNLLISRDRKQLKIGLLKRAAKGYKNKQFYEELKMKLEKLA